MSNICKECKYRADINSYEYGGCVDVVGICDGISKFEPEKKEDICDTCIKRDIYECPLVHYVHNNIQHCSAYLKKPEPIKVTTEEIVKEIMDDVNHIYWDVENEFRQKTKTTPWLSSTPKSK